jgi:hypothetical protein
MTLSLPGTQSTLNSMSITSSLPTPRNTQFSSGTPRNEAIFAFRSSWVGEGYRFRPKISSSDSRDSV